MGDAANAAMTNAFLEVSAELKRVTTGLDRSTLQTTRVANEAQDARILVETQARDTKLAIERNELAVKELNERQARLEAKVDTLLIQRGLGDPSKDEKKRGPIAEAIHAFGAMPPSARWALVLLAPSLVVIGMAVHELFLK